MTVDHYEEEGGWRNRPVGRSSWHGRRIDRVKVVSEYKSRCHLEIRIKIMRICIDPIWEALRDYLGIFPTYSIPKHLFKNPKITQYS